MEPKSLQSIRFESNLTGEGLRGESVATERAMAHDALAMIHYRDVPAILLFARDDAAAEPARGAV